MFDRLNRALQQALDPDKVGAPAGRQPTVDSLLPGDVVSLWDGTDCIVDGVLACSEELNGRTTTWRWNLLDGGRLLESAPDGKVLYGRSVVLHQDTAEFETLTCDPADGGVLKGFEARVRSGTAARNPTLFEYGERVFRVVSTGIFAAQSLDSHGRPGAMPAAEVWRDVHPTQPGENVYFELEPTEDTGDESVVLGIWTTHILLLFGAPLSGADIRSIYPGAPEEPTHR